MNGLKKDPKNHGMGNTKKVRQEFKILRWCTRFKQESTGVTLLFGSFSVTGTDGRTNGRMTIAPGSRQDTGCFER